MKYMGSKRAMLSNGLGDLLAAEVPYATRFVDLFTGSSAVAIHVAKHFELPVLAYDLQSYSAVLAEAIIGRNSTIEWQNEFRNWKKRATVLEQSIEVPVFGKVSKRSVKECRAWCKEQVDLPITMAYGGHYFSPQQAVWIDAFRKKMPADEPAKIVALAALIQAASQCAAAPGHTAQPFQPTQTAKQFLQEAWDKEILNKVAAAFEALAGQHAKQKGESSVADANDAAAKVREGDLVFIDPPYSGVHYSRFYHVLETIAQGACGEVSGTGRYPAPEKRPRSKYSVTSESKLALEDLLKTISLRGARAIITFPDHECSNGLSGDSVREIASRHFKLSEKVVKSKFSTLGGTGNEKLDNEGGRSARRHADELILVLAPK